MDVNVNVYELMYDGACNPNPGGDASFGFVLYLNGSEINRGFGFIGRSKHMTNVVAEYNALSTGLAAFIRLFDKPNSILNVYGDSQYVTFIVNSVMNNEVKLSSQEFPELKIIDLRLQQIRGMGVKITINWFSRDKNTIADELSKIFRKGCSSVKN